MNGINSILDIMKGFGLLGHYSNSLILGTSKSDTAWGLYQALKSKELEVDNRPDELTRYDFIYISYDYNDNITLNKLLTKLREGGIILVPFKDIYHLRLLNGNLLQINKNYSLVKGK